MMATYRHEPKVMTAGELRELLAEVPDDMPVSVSTLRDPSSRPDVPQMEECSFVVTEGAIPDEWVPPDRKTGKEGHYVPGSTFELLTDWSPGDYEYEPGGG